MKYFTDGTETWAAESLQNLKKELVENQHIIDEKEFYDYDWLEVPEDMKAWVIELSLGQIHRMRNDKSFRSRLRRKYYKTLKEIYEDFTEKRENVFAYFLCASE